MPPSSLTNQQSSGTGLYGAARTALRFLNALRGRRIRVLRGDSFAESQAVLVVVARPPNLRDALSLIACLERKVRILVPQEVLARISRRLLARVLEMIPYEESDAAWQWAAGEALSVLHGDGALAVFAGSGDASAPAVSRAADLAVDAEAAHSNTLGLTVLPAHILPPVAGSRETLIHFGQPLFPQDTLAEESTAPQPAAPLRFALRRTIEENPFALRPETVEHILADAEQILKAALEREWSSRPNWKQQVDGFRLSRPLARWVEEVNAANPEHAVALGQALAAHREARRRWALGDLQINSGRQSRPLWLRTAASLESVLGFPVAVYGLINHLVFITLLRVTGLWRLAASTLSQWVTRGLLLVGCYAVEIALVGYFWGRAAAGYYAVTLPVPGAYLWRYFRLFRRRTPLLMLSFLQGSRQSQLRRLEQRLLDQLDRVEHWTQNQRARGRQGAA